MIDNLLKIALSIISAIGSIFAFYCNVKSYFEERKPCPKISNKILLLSASTLTEQIRNKQITCTEVVQAYIERINEVNPVVNAVVEERFDTAIQEAETYDQMLTQQIHTNAELIIKYPLLGVPITVKESIGVKGMSHTAAQVHLQGVKADRDAEVVTLIKEAGGIILLVSNTPELCGSMETYNNITGLTRNPYDTRKTPGGSSGGEAALLGSGATLIGIGSDMLGSVRLPGSFCGVWAHKPTSGAISIDLHKPTCSDEKLKAILTIGPLTRYQVDLQLILNIMLTKHVRSSIELPKHVPLHEITVYYIETHLKSTQVEAEIRRALTKILVHLQYQCKCKVKKVNFKQKYPMIFYKYLGHLRNFTGLFENRPSGYFLELLYYLIGKSDLSFNHIFLGLVQKIFLRFPDSVYEESKKQIENMKMEFSQTIGNNGVLLMPTHPTSATNNGHFLKKCLDYEYTSIFNILGIPATQCPAGLNSNGLPIGIQVAAVAYNDGLCLRVAEEIDKIYGGWIPPTFSTLAEN